MVRVHVLGRPCTRARLWSTALPHHTNPPFVRYYYFNRTAATGGGAMREGLSVLSGPCSGLRAPGSGHPLTLPAREKP